MIVFKYLSYGLMFVLLGILGVGVFLFYIMKNLFEPMELEDDETDEWE